MNNKTTVLLNVDKHLLDSWSELIKIHDLHLDGDLMKVKQDILSLSIKINKLLERVSKEDHTE